MPVSQGVFGVVGGLSSAIPYENVFLGIQPFSIDFKKGNHGQDVLWVIISGFNVEFFGTLSVMQKNNKLPKAELVVGDKYPVKVKYKEFEDKFTLYFKHNECYIRLWMMRLDDSFRHTYQTYNSEDEFPSDAIDFPLGK